MSSSHALIQAYIDADPAGKAIFIALFALSCISWILLLQKVWILWRMKRTGLLFRNFVEENHAHLLKIDPPAELLMHQAHNPFFSLFHTLKTRTQILLNKNGLSGLIGQDVELLGAYLDITISQTFKKLERQIFLLSTIATLGPFLGLLGTVWGILTTFSQMGAKATGISNDQILTGLAMALGTTIWGLFVAIPALIGYSVIKNGNREMHAEMEEFSTFLLATVQLQYQRGGQ